MQQRIVAIYARVSTEHEAQLSALENQVQYYDEILSRHPEWKVYDRYIDEGITGTSTKKRKNFMRMMKDASDGMFDLIITREVSRFARNTVDTLQETRNLKRMGIEVWFTEDNIWTMNDEDGELRLTIMATLAQNESKKTSLRVKAGQMISYKNGVPYGNGNILGYDRDGKKYVINPEQAETVRMAFDMALEGAGSKKIACELEKRGRLTATGLTRWYGPAVNRVLQNPFYCGTVVYRKQYVPDYLEQKSINNFGEVEKIVVEGSHEPIVTKEEFATVQKLIASRTMEASGKGIHRQGIKPTEILWCKKLKCSCGHSFNKKIWHRCKDGTPRNAYQCYEQVRRGTVASRTRAGLSLEGVCESPMIPEWKLDVMAKVVFEQFCHDKRKIISIANQLLEKHLNGEDSEYDDEIKKLEGKIERCCNKLDNLLDLRIEGEIDKVKYTERKEKITKELEIHKKQLTNLLDKGIDTKEDFEKKLEALKQMLDMNMDFDTNRIPECILDAFVDEIVVYKDRFVWKLNFDEVITCLAGGTAKRPEAKIIENPYSGEQQHRLLSTKGGQSKVRFLLPANLCS